MKCQSLKLIELKLCIEINDTINILAQKQMFKTKQDLFDVLLTFEEPSQPSEPYEYVTEIHYSNTHDLSRYTQQAEFINLTHFSSNLNINCVTNTIHLNIKYIKNIRNLNLGTQKMLDSVKTINLLYECVHD